MIYSLRELVEQIYTDAGYNVQDSRIKKAIIRIIRNGKAEDMIRDHYGKRLEIIISKRYILKQTKQLS